MRTFGLTEYICHNGDLVEVETCLKGCVQPDKQWCGGCVPYPVREILSHRKERTDKFSVTEGVGETRQIYLKRKFPYAIKPMDYLFLVIGTAFHLACANVKQDAIVEEHLENDFMYGHPDFITIKRIDDYKTTSLGRNRYFLSGDNPEIPEEWIYQDNGYLDLAREHGFREIDTLVNWAIAKDAKKGDPCNVIPIRIPILEYGVASKYIKARLDILKNALDADVMPPVCEHRFDNDSKCWDWCEINKDCPYFQQIQSQSEPIKKPDNILILNTNFKCDKMIEIICQELRDIGKNKNISDEIIYIQNKVKSYTYKNNELIQTIDMLSHAKAQANEATKEVKELKAKLKPTLIDNPNILYRTPEGNDAYIATSKRSSISKSKLTADEINRATIVTQYPSVKTKKSSQIDSEEE